MYVYVIVNIISVTIKSFSCKKKKVKSGTMIKILPLDILVVSHRIPWKNKNAGYRLQIPALVPEIFKFEKWVKYANEMTGDVIHSTQ